MLGDVRSHPAYPYMVRVLLIGLAIVLVFQVMGMWHTTEYGSPGATDLIAYWTAGQLLRAGENPYDFDKLYQLQLDLGSQNAVPTSMWNPPWLLIWIFPLLLLDFPVAVVMWLFVNLGLILACGTFVWRTLARPSAASRIGIAWVATIAFVPALFTLRMGQISTVVLLGVVGFLYFASQDRDIFAGMCLALTTVKPHIVYLLWIAVAWWVITEKRWKTAAGAVSLLLPSLAILTSMWPDWTAGYYEVVAYPPVTYAAPTVGVVLRLIAFQDSSWIQFAPSIVGGLSLLGYLLFKRSAIRWRTVISPILLASAATAAYGWSFDYIVLLVPYLQIVLWLSHGSSLNLNQQRVLIVSLVLVEGMMIAQNLMRVNAAFFFWIPWALSAIYLCVQASRSRENTSACPGNSIGQPEDRRVVMVGRRAGHTHLELG